MRLKSVFLAAFLILFFMPPAYAIELKNPMAVEQLEISFTQHGALTLSGDVIEYAGIKITTPQNTDNQAVSPLSGGTLVQDSFGNKKLSIEEKNPQKDFTYSITGTAKITAVHTYSLPQSYTIPESAKIYLFPTKHIQSDDLRIRSLAREITKGAGTDFEKVSLLATWVNSNVNYTLSLGSEAKDALWVLDNRMGTCDEFTALFIALARSIGIPAKYVSGYVYGDAGWQKHAWAEVYLGKWVPVDATWLEVGRLDATHIKFFETDDNYVANDAKSYGSENGKIAWIDDETDIEISGYKESVQPEYDAHLSAEKLSGGKDFVFIAKVSPEEYSVDKLTLVPCTGMDILRIGDKKKIAVLEPKKQEVIAWKVSINPDLDRSKIYSCPMVLNSNLFKKKTMNFDVDPRVQTDLTLGASLEKSFYDVGETVTVDVRDTGTVRGGERVGVVADDFYDERTMTPDNNRFSFSFQAKAAGDHSVMVYDSAGNVLELGYSVQEMGNVFMEKIVGPNFALLNSKPEVAVYVKNEMRSQQNIKLDTKINDALVSSEIFTVPAQSVLPVNISVPADAVGDKRLSIRLSADSVEETLKNVRIYDVPEILLGTEYNSGAKKAAVIVSAQKDEAKNIKITLAGKIETIASSSENKTAYFGVPAGEYVASVKYEDVAGNKYTAEKKLVFRESWWDKLIYWIKNIFG